MALPDSWLDHLFGKLAVRYGDAWDRKWNGVPMHLVRADWAQVLDGLKGEALSYGLQYLPDDYPPTASAFRALCNQRPEPQPLALPAPDRVDGARLQQLRGRLASALSATRRDPRAWSRRLLDRHAAGQRVATPAALEMARSALAARVGEMGVCEDHGTGGEEQ